MLSTVSGCNEQTWIQGKKDDLPDSSVSSLLDGFRFCFLEHAV